MYNDVTVEEDIQTNHDLIIQLVLNKQIIKFNYLSYLSCCHVHFHCMFENPTKILKLYL